MASRSAIKEMLCMPYTIACNHCDLAVLTTHQLTPADWGSMRGHLADCPRWQGSRLPEDIGDVLTNFRVRRVSEGNTVAPKPLCRLKAIETQYSILYRVRDALMGAGHGPQAEEFMARARECAGAAETMEIAAEYVEID